MRMSRRMSGKYRARAEEQSGSRRKRMSRSRRMSRSMSRSMSGKKRARAEEQSRRRKTESAKYLSLTLAFNPWIVSSSTMWFDL
jgi:hypothetical protein